MIACAAHAGPTDLAESPALERNAPDSPTAVLTGVFCANPPQTPFFARTLYRPLEPLDALSRSLMRRAAATAGFTDAGPPPVTHVRNTTIAGNTPNAGHGGDEIVYSLGGNRPRARA
jgi:hypothetical protein